jgi:hypothetical protein
MFAVGATPPRDRRPRLAKPCQDGRRTRALALKPHGGTPAKMAAAWGVAAAAVSPGGAAAGARGREAWRAPPRPPGPITRSPDRRHVGPARLAHGAAASGCRGALWPCARVAPGLGAAFGGSSHQAHGTRLWQRLDWPPPRPSARGPTR